MFPSLSTQQPLSRTLRQTLQSRLSNNGCRTGSFFTPSLKKFCTFRSPRHIPSHHEMAHFNSKEHFIIDQRKYSTASSNHHHRNNNLSEVEVFNPSSISSSPVRISKYPTTGQNPFSKQENAKTRRGSNFEEFNRYDEQNDTTLCDSFSRDSQTSALWDGILSRQNRREPSASTSVDKHSRDNHSNLSSVGAQIEEQVAKVTKQVVPETSFNPQGSSSNSSTTQRPSPQENRQSDPNACSPSNQSVPSNASPTEVPIYTPYSSYDSPNRPPAYATPPPNPYSHVGSVQNGFHTSPHTSPLYYHYQAPKLPKPRRIIIMRHGQSLANVDKTIHTHTPDYKIPLTRLGVRQALEAGRRMSELVPPDESVKFWVSPYYRARETFEQVVQSFENHSEITYYEEVRLREQEWGNFQDAEEIRKISKERKRYGPFYYRFPNGESGSDVYDRISAFLETFFRHFGRQDNMVLISHGLTCRLFLMRWFKWSVKLFHRMNNFDNAQFVVMELQDNGKYKIGSPLKLRSGSEIDFPKEDFVEDIWEKMREQAEASIDDHKENQDKLGSRRNTTNHDIHYSQQTKVEEDDDDDSIFSSSIRAHRRLPHHRRREAVQRRTESSVNMIDADDLRALDEDDEQTRSESSRFNFYISKSPQIAKVHHHPKSAVGNKSNPA